MGKNIKYSYIIDSKQAISSLEKINRALDKTSKKIKGTKTVGPLKSGEGVSNVGSNLKTSSLIGVAALAGLGSSMLALGSQAIQTAAKVESLDTAIKFIGGTRGQFQLRQLENTIAELSLDTVSAKEGFKLWSASIKNTSLEGMKGFKIFKTFSKATKKLGLTAETTKGAFLALSQIQNKGKVSSEELYQLFERGVGSMDLAAKSANMTTQEFIKMVGEGKLLAKDFLEPFAEQLEETFGGEITKKMTDSITRLSNVWTTSLASMGKKLAPFVSLMADMGEAMAGMTPEQLIARTSVRYKDMGSQVSHLIKKSKEGVFTNEEFAARVQLLGKKFGDLAPILNELPKSQKEALKTLKEIPNVTELAAKNEAKKLKLIELKNKLVEEELVLQKGISLEMEHQGIMAQKNVKDLDKKEALRLRQRERAVNKNKASNLKSQQDLQKQISDLEGKRDKLSSEIDDTTIKVEKTLAPVKSKVTDKDKTDDKNPIADSMANSVRGVSGQVKNITVNVDSVQKIDTQNINSGDDIESLGVQLEELMARITLDIAQK